MIRTTLAALFVLLAVGCSTTTITPSKYETSRSDFTMRLTPSHPPQNITVTPSPVVIVVTPIEDSK